MTYREKVFAALQEWRDSEETQKAMRDKPVAYDGVIALQAEAVSRATWEDWKNWAKTIEREGSRSCAMEIAMVGSNIRRANELARS